MILSTYNDYNVHQAVYQRTTQKRHTEIMGVNKGFVYNKIELAEREGFEPTVRFPVLQFSRLAPSTTRPPLRLLQFYYSLQWPGMDCHKLFRSVWIDQYLAGFAGF